MAINIKHYLADALIELSLERPLSKITVRDITSKIGAGRQTFYNHFKDKNDLIYYIFLQTLAGERDILETSGFYAYLVALYAKAQKNSHFFKEAVKLTGQKIRECLNHSDGFSGVAVDFIGSLDSQQSAADNDSVLTMIFQPGSERIYIIHSPYSEYSL